MRGAGTRAGAGTEVALGHEAADLGWELRDLKQIGGGLEFLVFEATVDGLGRLALRVPRVPWISNDNDPDVEAFRLLDQEAMLAAHIADAGLPAPRVHLLHRGRRCDFLAVELIAHDGSVPRSADLGRLVRTLHELPAPDLIPVMDTFNSVPVTLAERLARRAGVVERLSGTHLGLPNTPVLAEALAWAAAERRLLHMDVRAENVLTRDGEIVALVDWSNALLGDPALELARASEYGVRDESFADGYGNADPLARAPRAVELLYRLDAAVMLAVVFLSEAPNRALAAVQVRRVLELTHALRAEL
jgi:aminoglycoside phosphotransferase (APT) family kinase protein